MADSMYVKTKVGDDIKFEVSPASVPLGIGTTLAIALLMSPTLLVGGYGVMIYLAINGFFFYYNYYSGKVRKYRSPSEFYVSKGQLKLSTGVVNASDISRLIMKNHVSNMSRGSTSGGVFVAGSGVAGVAAATSVAAVSAASSVGAALGNQRHADVAKTSWRVEVETGGRAIALAGGLNETTAYGLMSDVQKSL